MAASGTHRTVEVEVHGMTCDSCEQTVQRGLSWLAGVERVEVDLDRARAVVTGEVDDEAVRQRVLHMGYDLAPTTDRSWPVRRSPRWSGSSSGPVWWSSPGSRVP